MGSMGGALSGSNSNGFWFARSRELSTKIPQCCCYAARCACAQIPGLLPAAYPESPEKSRTIQKLFPSILVVQNAQPSHGRGLFVCAGRMCGLARLRESAIRRRIRKFGPAGGELPVGSHWSASRPPLRKKAIGTLMETIGGRLGLFHLSSLVTNVRCFGWRFLRLRI